MRSQNLYLKPIISTLLFVGIVFGIIAVFGRILTPFIIALILTYILNPIVEKITQRLKIKRSIISLIISIIIFIAFVSIPLFIIPGIAVQLKATFSKTPDLINFINNRVLLVLNQKYGSHFELDIANIRSSLINNVSKAYQHVNIFSPIAKNSVILIEIIVYIILIPFVLFYSICGWHSIIKFFDKLIPRSHISTVHAVVRDIDKMLSAYLRGQISVMIVMALYYGIALNFTGITAGVIIGIITGTLVFIPYIGIFTGLLIALAMAFSNFHGTNPIFAILGIFIVGHLLEGGLITPYLVGGKIGLNPVMVILSLMIFGKLFGLVGILLALPLATITVVLLRYAKHYYMNSKYYNEEIN